MSDTRMIEPEDKTRLVPPGEAAGASAFPEVLSLTCLLGKDKAPSTEYSFAYLLVKLQALASAADTGARAPLNLCLVIDRSGSMDGEPIEFVKQAACYIIDSLEASDILSAIAFDDHVETIIPARKVVNKELIKSHIQRIRAGGQTNLYEGMSTGINSLAAVLSPGYVNRILLLTDGEPTTGVADYQSFFRLSQEARSKGIVLTTLGAGYEYNEELMVGISKASGGNYYYISNPQLIPEIFRKELHTLLAVLATNLRLKVEFPRWVHLRQSFTGQVSQSYRAAEVTLPDLERGASLACLLELGLEARPGGPYRICKVKAIYDNCLSGQKDQTLSCDVVCQFTSDKGAIPGELEPEVEKQLNLMLASRNLEKTMIAVKTQQISISEAIGQLEQTKVLLLDQGKQEEAEQLEKAISSLSQQKDIADATKSLTETKYLLDQGKSKG